ncbi:MAG: YceI family protein [Chloroflexi bacterium]|nr:MAG: YceI family protein [Chloroflexota bacterium]
MSRRVWIIVVAIVIIFLGLLAGINYAAVVASKSTNSNSTNTATSTSPDTVPTQATTNSTQVCGASVSASDLRTFQIVPQQTTASYKVRENLIAFNLPAHNAVGTTHKVTGHFNISRQGTPLVANMNMTVDLRDLHSDSSTRDDYVRKDYLETDKYPNATFKSTCAQNLPKTYQDGQQVTFQMPGDLTVHGKTKQATFLVQGKVVGNTITGTATTTVLMSQFGIAPPNLANFVVAEDKTVITIEFTAKEG